MKASSRPGLVIPALALALASAALASVSGCRGLAEAGEPVGTLQPPEVTEFLGAVPPTAFLFRDWNVEGFPEYIFEIDGSLMVGIPATDGGTPFLIDKFEITNSQYRTFCSATSRIMPKHPTNPAWRHYYFLPKPSHPIDHVAWFDAHDYAIWSGKALPTAAEWTLAAMGKEPPPWMDGPPGLAVANTREVGSYPADVSSYGVYDMAGNVDEWAADAGYGSGRRVMGGNWGSTREELERLVSMGSTDDAHEPQHGFRTIFRLTPIRARGE